MPRAILAQKEGAQAKSNLHVGAEKGQSSGGTEDVLRKDESGENDKKQEGQPADSEQNTWHSRITSMVIEDEEIQPTRVDLKEGKIRPGLGPKNLVDLNLEKEDVGLKSPIIIMDVLSPPKIQHVGQSNTSLIEVDINVGEVEIKAIKQQMVMQAPSSQLKQSSHTRDVARAIWAPRQKEKSPKAQEYYVELPQEEEKINEQAKADETGKKVEQLMAIAINRKLAIKRNKDDEQELEKGANVKRMKAVEDMGLVINAIAETEEAVRALKDLVSYYKPQLLFLCETKARKRKMENLRRRLHFDDGYVVEANGKSGRLALFWQKDLSVDVRDGSKNYIHARIKKEGDDRYWWLTGVNKREIGNVKEKIDRVLVNANSLIHYSYATYSALPTIGSDHSLLVVISDNWVGDANGLAWDELLDDLIKAIKEFFTNEHLPEDINLTHITLVPKVADPEDVTQFRPISYSNFIYKVVLKILANRLKPLMNFSLISQNQSAFVSGRKIQDNILVAQEVFHFLKKNKATTKGVVALKIDMSKAFDRIEWSFLKKVLIAFGFEEKWVRLIMKCVSSVTYQIKFNGDIGAAFNPKRGLRQGDPLLTSLSWHWKFYLFKFLRQRLRGASQG
ncbi:reverse transcriptase [Senna tora]|uniref:Reverse transcriptase n=1 Tax=Senna tora TaxID=362788 RepID=A0A834XGA9_9FABA|nr:reverse transcriptase [Senna tora]